MPIYMMKTKLVLAGKSKAEIVQATASALDKKELPALEPGAMCYMMSKRQYLSDQMLLWNLGSTGAEWRSNDQYR
jgi:hypothetical protein